MSESREEGDDSPGKMLDLSQIAGVLTKQAPSVLFAAAASTGIVLFGPDRFVRACRLIEAREAHGPVIGAVFLGTFWLFVVSAGWPLVVAWAAAIREKKRDRQRLHELSEHEQLILTRYVNGQSYTEDFEINDGVVANLVCEGILYELPPKREGAFAPFGIEKWARDYLYKNPGLLGRHAPRPGIRSQDVPPIREKPFESGPSDHR